MKKMGNAPPQLAGVHHHSPPPTDAISGRWTIVTASSLSLSLGETLGYVGSSSKGPEKDYSLNGNTETRVFGIFNAIAIIATTFGNGIIPEIQATLAPPVKGKMFKGLCVCYAVLIATFFSVAISGYWAFGNQAEGLILSNFLDSDGNALVPKWFIMMTNVRIWRQSEADYGGGRRRAVVVHSPSSSSVSLCRTNREK